VGHYKWSILKMQSVKGRVSSALSTRQRSLSSFALYTKFVYTILV
jgi:hypothetical protein